MTKAAERDLSRIGWLDYVLMCIGSCFAVYSAGMSLQLPSISFFCVILVLLGSGVSYGIRKLSIHSPFIKLDAFLYSGGVIASIFLSTELREIMPDGGFPREMGAAGWLTWMIILGSFATWQDSTLLFQAIPAMALFGLIGCYDTYRAVTLAFFAFLICLATLFARAHGREMLRKAAESGYFTRGLAPGAPIPSVETTPGLALELKKGPWRWIAGPEWALASAVAVVLISLLGAPVIRDSVSSVGGGFVKINQPPIRPHSAPVTPSTADVSGQVVRIGRPYQHAIARRLFEVQSERGAGQYLRAELYDYYTGHGWQNTLDSDFKVPADSPLVYLGQSRIKDPIQSTFRLHLDRFMKLLPVPPDTLNVTVKDGKAQLLPDGTWGLDSASPQTEIDVSGVSSRPKDGALPIECLKSPYWGNFVETARVPAVVQQLAVQVTSGAKTDYAKAMAIQSEITRRIVYNLDAEETPQTSDPVQYALFEQKEGYCTAFASAMVVMARSAGLPARYVQGYLTDERRREPHDVFTVTDADYHAWAEIYFKDFGWVIFDPTIGAQSKPGEGLGDVGDNRPWYQHGIISFVFDVAILATLVGLAATGISFFKSRRRFASIRTEVERVYVSFCVALERVAGRRRNVGQTADEFLESIRPSLNGTYRAAKDLNARFVTAMYSAEGIDPDALLRLREDVKAFQGELKKAAKQTKGGKR